MKQVLMIVVAVLIGTAAYIIFSSTRALYFYTFMTLLLYAIYIWPTKEMKSIKQCQIKLNTLGYDCGKANGRLNKRTKNAIKKYQIDHDMSVTNYVNFSLKEALDI